MLAAGVRGLRGRRELRESSLPRLAYEVEDCDRVVRKGARGEEMDGDGRCGGRRMEQPMRLHVKGHEPRVTAQTLQCFGCERTRLYRERSSQTREEATAKGAVAKGQMRRCLMTPLRSHSSSSFLLHGQLKAHGCRQKRHGSRHVPARDLTRVISSLSPCGVGGRARARLLLLRLEAYGQEEAKEEQ